MESITEVNWKHGKRICKRLWKNLWEYLDFYLRSDLLLSSDVFENFRKLFLKIYELDLAKSFSAPGLAWQAALKI